MKGYWISCYRSISDPQAVTNYAALAGPAIQAGGGRVLARGTAAKAFEAGLVQRTVLIEFESVARAVQTYESAAYQEALKKLAGAADRDLRIVEGLA